MQKKKNEMFLWGKKGKRGIVSPEKFVSGSHSKGGLVAPSGEEWERFGGKIFPV